MFQKLAVSLACYLLKQELSIEQKNRLSISILDSLEALPLATTFSYSEEDELLVNGKVISIEQAIVIRESAKVALDNKALVLIRDQVAYEAIVNGVHKVNGDSGQLFMRAALWWEQECHKLLLSLAGRSSS